MFPVKRYRPRGSVLFDDATPDYLSVATAAISSYPCTILGWFYADDLSSNHHPFSLGTASNNDQLFIWTDSSGNINARLRVGAGNHTSITTTAASLNTWHHFCYVMTSTSLREIYLDAGGKGIDNDVGVSFPSMTKTTIGIRNSGTTGGGWSGGLAGISIHNVAFDATDIKRSAAGDLPETIRPQNLVFHSELTQAGDYRDKVGGLQFVPIGKPISSNAPPQLELESYNKIILFPEVAVGGVIGKSNPLSGPLGGPLAGVLG